MQTQYSIKITARSAKGRPVKGELYEGDICIATFSKPANTGWNYWQVKVRFLSERSQTRFESFCDSLSVSETLEALSQ